MTTFDTSPITQCCGLRKDIPVDILGYFCIYIPCFLHIIYAFGIFHLDAIPKT